MHHCSFHEIHVATGRISLCHVVFFFVHSFIRSLFHNSLWTCATMGVGPVMFLELSALPNEFRSCISRSQANAFGQTCATCSRFYMMTLVLCFPSSHSLTHPKNITTLVSIIASFSVAGCLSHPSGSWLIDRCIDVPHHIVGRPNATKQGIGPPMYGRSSRMYRIRALDRTPWKVGHLYKGLLPTHKP